MGLAIITALGAGDASAQSPNSASQVVTFGVRRTAAMVAPRVQSTSSRVMQSGSTGGGPLKVTVGNEFEPQITTYLTTSRTLDVASWLEHPSTFKAMENDGLQRRGGEALKNTGPFAAKATKSKKLLVTVTD